MFLFVCAHVQAALLTRERALLTQLSLEHTLHRKHQALDAANAAGPAAFQKAQTLTNTCLDLQVCGESALCEQRAQTNTHTHTHTHTRARARGSA